MAEKKAKPKAIAMSDGKKPAKTSRVRHTLSKDKKAELVAALPAFNYNASAVARVAGVSHDAVSKAANDPEIAKMAIPKKAELAAGFASLTQKLLTRFSDIADTASLDNKGATLLGIVADKALLYAGEANQITASVELKRIAEETLAEYEQCTADREEALRLLREDVPELASALIN